MTPSKRPPRFALGGADPKTGVVRIGGSELHHMRDVMRLGRDSEVALIDEDGTEYIGRIELMGSSHADVRLLSTHRGEAACRMTLAIAIIKGARMDFVVEKAAELGAVELWPLECARSEVHTIGSARIERWRRLATAAAKQSLASLSMRICDPIGFDQMLAKAQHYNFRLICRLGAAPIAPAIRAARPASLLIACGPEGDFTPEEITAANNAGFMAASLGNNRLRSETAAMAALSIAAAALAESYGESE